MPSTPLICSSIGVATVSAITLGFAPGYCARTTIEGGTTSGYSAIGRKFNAIAPARKMSSEITPAKIGRSMKNLERFIPVTPASARVPRSFAPAKAGDRLLGYDVRSGLRHLHGLRQHEAAR